jgi:hypothetical protein
MTATRVYTRDEVYRLLSEARAHGSYRRLLKREGLDPVTVTTHEDGTQTTYYNAESVDQLIKDICS